MEGDVVDGKDGLGFCLRFVLAVALSSRRAQDWEQVEEGEGERTLNVKFPVVAALSSTYLSRWKISVLLGMG